tara:strand:- start:51958 stop:53091 length:1134 start_codon:yes stop_codon:yes gene_type:complete
MAVSSYQKNGKTLFKAYINERSKIDRKIRVQRSKSGFENEAEARREEKKLVRLVVEEIASIESKGITWKELIYRWEMCAINNMAGKKYSRPAINDHVSTLDLHTHAWQNKRVRELGRSDGRYLINSLTKESYSLSRIKAIKGSINKVWTWGVEEGLISGGIKSPVHGLVIESEKNKYKPILTLNEVKKLMYEAQLREHPWRHIWAIALLTGMRSGELFALTWDDIDFDNNIIRITKSYSPRIRGIKSTKNSEWRNAHISKELKQVLIELKQNHYSGENVLPRLSGWNCGLAGNALRAFLIRIGIDKYVTFHTLRACFATHVLASGVEPTKVMKMGGWADFKTFQIYIRMAGVDVKGVTDNFRVMPELGLLDNVIKLK